MKSIAETNAGVYINSTFFYPKLVGFGFHGQYVGGKGD